MIRISDINQEIANKTNLLERLKKEIQSANYSDISTEKVIMFIPLFLLIVVVPLYFFAQYLVQNGKLSFLGMLLGFIWLGVYILYFITACRTFARDIAYSAAKVIFIIWAAVFFANVASLLLFFNHWLPDNTIKMNGLFTIDLSGHINSSSFPVYFINEKTTAIVLKYWVGSVVLSTIPSFLVFLATLIQLIKEAVKRKACKKELERITAQIEETETAIQALNEESRKNIEEAERIYNAEIQKENPSTDIMIQAADGGCADAALWVALGFAQKLLSEKNKKSKEMIAFSAQKIRAYTQLAIDCRQKDLCTALDVWSYVYTKQIGLASFASTREQLNELKDMKEKVSGLIGSKNELVCVFAEEANSELQDGISRAERVLQKKEAEEAERRQYNSISSYSDSYYGGYYGSYDADRSLSASELLELNHQITGGLWNPSAIDHSDLSDSQKKQLKDYNRIYGD